MVHSAFDSVELIPALKSKIQTLTSHNSTLYISTTDSSLHIYNPSAPSQPYDLDRTLPSFWKKPPVQMEACKSRDLLISLSDWIMVHRLPGLELLVAISKSRGGNVFCWDEKRGLLCVGKQKRVAIYRLDGGREFVEVKEFPVSDVVKSMAWSGENICLGIKKDYMIMNSITGALSEVFPCGRLTSPLVVPLPSGDLLLGKDNIGVFVDQNGKLLQDGRICWSQSPLSVVIQKPFAVGRLPRHIEIRSLRAPYPLVQTVVLRDVNLLIQGEDCVVAALSNSVHGLFPVPLGAQIVQLTASGDFEEALALCKLLPPEDSSLRASKESSIHIRYGHYLFDSGNYEESMEQFFASQVDITYVLSLYPCILLPKGLSTVDPENSSDSTVATHLSRASSDASDDIDPSQFHDSDDRSVLEIKKTNHNSLAALGKYLQKKRHSIIDRATAEVTEEVVLDAQSNIKSDQYRPKNANKRRGHTNISSAAREMAAILDTALIQALIYTGQSSAALELLKGPNYCDLKICEEFVKERNSYTVLLELYKYNEMHKEALKLLHHLVEETNLESTNSDLARKFKPQMIIDYLKPLCKTDPMLVLEFSTHVLESCPTETIELFLSGNIPADLVNSYLKQHVPAMQSTYLELMLSMSENGINTNLQSELVQIYLSEVIDWYKDLKEQKQWDEKSYSPTRRKLISALESISGSIAATLLKRLPQDALFEERALMLGKMNQHQLALSLYVSKLHMPELALAYCDRVYEAGINQSSRSHSNIYLTLLQIYLNPRKSTKQAEQKILVPLPSQNINTPRVKSKNRSGRTGNVVEIEVADELRFNTSSTDSGKSDGDGEEMNEEEGSSIMLNEVLDLLSQKWDRINGSQALKLLPRATKLQNLLQFLEPLLRKSSEGLRNYAVIKSLRYSENLQVKDEFYKHRRKVVKIDGDSTCSFCSKKIGATSVFAVYPNGKTLVHFNCLKNMEGTKGAPKRGTLG